MRLPLEFLAQTFGLASKWLASSEAELISSETQRWIDNTRSLVGVPGLSLAVVHGEKTQVLGFGTADAAGNQVTPDTLFAIASNSKLFVGISLGLLMEKGSTLMNGKRLGWDTKVADILDEWLIPDAYASAHSTLQDLACMPSHDLSHTLIPPLASVANMRNLRETGEIRAGFQYNNMHYSALAEVIANVSGMPYIDFVQQYILDPLSMHATTFNSTVGTASGKRSDGFSHTSYDMAACRARSKPEKGLAGLDESCSGPTEAIGWWTAEDGTPEAGPGSLLSSGIDLTRWLTELLSPTVLPEQVIAHCAAPRIVTGRNQPDPELAPITYGVGQMQTTYRGYGVVFHTGGLPGQVSLVLRLPREKIAVAVLTNDAELGGDAMYPIAFRIVDELLGLEPIDWEDRFARRHVARLGPKKPADTPTLPSIPLDRVPGTYTNAGYGPLTVTSLEDPACAFSPDQQAHIRQRIGIVLETSQKLTLFTTPLDKLFVSHLVFVHLDADTWSVVVIKELNGVMMMYPEGEAVVTGAGIGMFSGFSTPGDVRLNETAVEDAEQRAEVWFKRS